MGLPDLNTAQQQYMGQQVGGYGYTASGSVAPSGTTTTVALASDVRLLSITVYANGADDSFTVNGGNNIQVRNGKFLTFEPKGALLGASIIFGDNLDYVVDHVQEIS